MSYPTKKHDEGALEDVNEQDHTIRNVSFEIRPGEKVALIGPSGAGKTTIMKLLLRYMDPNLGRITINGRDLRDIVLASWMQAVGYIAQRPQVFDGTIGENLVYALPHDQRSAISKTDIWDLMRRLKIDFGERRLTHGLDTKVGRDGIELSGGQAQRLMIGAAVMKKPRFMIIDEATSSLDSTTEKQVQQGLREVLTPKVGALIIAHRLSTVRNICDTFVVLQESSAVKNGNSQVEAIASSFEELYPLSATFRQLADDQGLAIEHVA